ncbi:arginyl-tRNA--protein transferase 1-like isoform X1 [Pomacea canaliculata]|uniref:arginyl-tRNA--protein transferase 1-like isoform X1 n=1 Tax=Pomacea canaliculata TaxID=400727 RepID=UPI000D72B48C|nr:arginyl-tRNA--protein transferase 1-like isoform X1 [Pomacea canaliculata]
MARRERSIVEYFAEHERYRCGYCGSPDTNYSHGMWAHVMTVQDYQDLIDRGWRRSGKYSYKPTMKVTCCPQYAIRCDAVNFQLSKSQKKVIKRVNRFLITGQRPGESTGQGEDSQNVVAEGPSGDNFIEPKKPVDLSLTTNDVKSERTAPAKNSLLSTSSSLRMTSQPESTGSSSENFILTQTSGQRKGKTLKSSPKPGCGADKSKPPCRKAKLIRLEHKEHKTGKAPVSIISSKNKTKPPKALEDFLNEPQRAENPAHQLEVKLVRTSPPSDGYRFSFKETHKVFMKYQMAIHKESAAECSKNSFCEFLVNSPLEALMPAPGEHGLTHGYGSFHQQYILDGKIIAVGVVDILPFCLSSVYLYYDPDYAFLSLGTYSALREIAFVREMQKVAPQLRFYYMGFYIHSCPKMRYKGQFVPSQLLCPETYTWIPIEKCVPKLDISRYARLEDTGKEDSEGDIDLDRVLVLYEGEIMPYEVYCSINPGTNDADSVREYATFVGRTCSQRMLLFRK